MRKLLRALTVAVVVSFALALAGGTAEAGSGPVKSPVKQVPTLPADITWE